MGGASVFTWEVVSQALLVVTLTDETHFLNKLESNGLSLI